MLQLKDFLGSVNMNLVTFLGCSPVHSFLAFKWGHLKTSINYQLEMFLAIARKLDLENFRDIPLRLCGTSRYSTEIAEAFITV